MGGGTSVNSLQRNMLRSCGKAPVRKGLIEMIENAGDKKHKVRLDDMMKTGRGAR